MTKPVSSCFTRRLKTVMVLGRTSLTISGCRKTAAAIGASNSCTSQYIVAYALLDRNGSEQRCQNLSEMVFPRPPLRLVKADLGQLGGTKVRPRKGRLRRIACRRTSKIGKHFCALSSERVNALWGRIASIHSPPMRSSSQRRVGKSGLRRFKSKFKKKRFRAISKTRKNSNTT